MNFKNIPLRANNFLIKLLQGIEKNLSPKVAVEKRESLFEDLAPIDNADEGEIYLSALTWALENEKVMNIALTGPYGSGKSSIIKTFEKRYPKNKYPQYNCLNISLATFKDNELTTDTPLTAEETPKAGKPKNEDNREENHRLIELSILQQMFYHETEERIPNSRFKRISQISRKSLLTNTVVIGLWLWGLVLLLKSKTMPQFTWWPAFYNAHSNWIILVALLLMLPGSFHILQTIIKQFNKISLSKFNFKSGEIEFNPKSETSILNKHLDEILYFFQVTQYTIVVIEDLDRFNDPEIFTKLRELNYLLNNSLQVGRRIVFLYAIKDDMFKDESRTKFFDFIIPVIPVINSNNSFEKMSAKLTSLGSDIKFNKDFVSDITLYIDDMRALKNIFNEYLIYTDLLKKISFKHDKLLAIIIYKNIHPKDFAQLHHNTGVLYNVFGLKPTIVSKLISENETQLVLTEQALIEANNSAIKKVNELRAIYLENFISRFPGFHSFSMSSDPVNLEAAKTDENFTELSKLTTIYYNVFNPSYGQVRRTSSGISFKEIEDSIDKNKTYDEREQIVKNASKSGITKLNSRISELKKSINEIRLMTLKELFDFDPGIISEFENEFTKDKLLVYLIREGWIDEFYSTLTSYFYEGSVSLNDMNFIMSIKNRETLEFDYALEKADSVLDRLKLEDFKREATLNYALLDYLVANHTSENSNKIDLIIEQLKSNTSNTRLFFFNYLTQGKNSGLFIAVIAKKWPLLWDTFNSDTDLDNVSKASLATMLIKYADILTVKSQGTSKQLQGFIESQPDFLEWFEPGDTNKVKQVITNLNLRFDNLEALPITGELFDFIYINNHYAINMHMISEIFKAKGQEHLLEKLSTENYTTIIASPFKELIEFIDANIEDYISNVLLKISSNKLESEASLIKLFSNVEAEEYIPAIIDQQDTFITDLKSVRSEIWQTLIEGKKVASTWHNVLNYYNTSKEIDEALISFIDVEENYELLSKSRFNADKEFDDAFYSAFSKMFLLASISNEAFNKILSNYPFYYDKPTGISFETLPEVKIKKVLNNRTLRLSLESYKLIQDNFDGLTTLLIENNAKEFFDDRASYDLDNNDYLVLLKSERLSQSEKIILIKELTPEIIDNVKGLGTLLSSLLVRYQYKQLSYEILQSILNSSQSLAEKLYLTSWHLNSLSKNEITVALKSLGAPYSQITEAKKKPTLPATEINSLLGQELENVGYIYKAKPEKDKLRFYNK